MIIGAALTTEAETAGTKVESTQIVDKMSTKPGPVTTVDSSDSTTTSIIETTSMETLSKYNITQ